MIKGIGTDIIEISRISKAIEKNDRFLSRVFTESEIEMFGRKGMKMETIAGNFAAKEAVLKVLGTGLRNMSWRDIEVLRDDLGKPHVVLHNNALDIMKHIEINMILVSISHSKDLAIAYAIGQ